MTSQEHFRNRFQKYQSLHWPNETLTLDFALIDSQGMEIVVLRLSFWTVNESSEPVNEARK